MLNQNSFSVSFHDGNIHDFLQNSFWRNFSPKQKEDLLDEMTNANNQYAMVNVYPLQRMIELCFKRNLPECSFIAGKWVELEDFDAFVRLAHPYQNANSSWLLIHLLSRTQTQFSVFSEWTNWKPYSSSNPPHARSKPNWTEKEKMLFFQRKTIFLMQQLPSIKKHWYLLPVF